MVGDSLYHGTHINRGKRILENNKMEYSRGNHEWLGDGIYLYRDALYVYRWLVIQYKSHYNLYPKPSEIFKKYMILGVDIDYQYDRVFSFLNPEHKMEFLEVKEQCRKSNLVYKRIQKKQITDGVILNLMFNSMGYGDNYDMVEAIFPLLDDENDTNTRLTILSEYQLCVKNPDKIKKIEDVTSTFSTDEYYKKLEKFNSYRTNNKKTNTYKIKRGYRYGK